MNTQLTETTVPRKSELTIRLERRGIDPMLWNAIGASIFPGASDDSKLMAIDYCKSRSLDIMKKPCHIVPMNVKDAKTGQYSWRDIIMPGIAELRITAERTGKYAGQDAPVFGPMVEMTFGKTEHLVPEFCTVTVHKIISGQRVAFTNTEFFEEACNTTKDGSLNSMWAKRRRGQLAKCAEAGALRKAFPEESGGIISAEETVDNHITVSAGRPLPEVPARISNPYAEPDTSTPNTFADLRGAIPDEPQAAPEAPVQDEAGERAALVAEIRKAIKPTECSTPATFAPRVREAGLLEVGVQLAACPLEDLRTIAANALDIAEGNYIPIA